MKSVSIKDIAKLKADGWKVDGRDMNAINAQLKTNQAAVAIVASLENIKDTILNAVKLLPQEDNSKFEALLSNHYRMISELLQQMPQRPTSWEFDVKRDNKGFIEKVVVDGRVGG